MCIARISFVSQGGVRDALAPAQKASQLFVYRELTERVIIVIVIVLSVWTTVEAHRHKISIWSVRIVAKVIGVKHPSGWTWISGGDCGTDLDIVGSKSAT